MDEALLAEEGGGGGGGGGVRGRGGASASGWGAIATASHVLHNHKRMFSKRSDAIAFGSPYQRAAALVDLAEDGIGLPEEIFDQPSFADATKSYFMFIRFDFLWTFNYFALIVLNFLEKPLWCSEDSCSNKDYYFLGDLPYLTGAESLIYEGVTLIILVIHTFFPISYEGFQIFWRNHCNKLKVILLILLVADLIVYAIYLSPVGFYSLPLRIAPYIRVIFFILNIRELRESIVVLAGMLGTYLNVLALFLLFLLFASWLAYVIFEDTLQGKQVFTSYSITLYQMFILFTTSNNPDVWIPAYKASRWSSIFFVLYVLIGVYFVTNLILAVVYDSFKSELAKQVAEKDRLKMRILRKAFDLIDDANGYLNKTQCSHLFEELNNYRSLPKISREDFELIFDELDDSHDFRINLDEFADLTDAIALRFQKEETPSLFESCPSFYHSPASEMFKDFIRGPKFEYIVAAILLVNLCAVVIETTLDITDSSGQMLWQTLEFAFGWLYVLEMALKIYAWGFTNYWRDGQNQFDFVVTLVIVIGETATFAAPNDLTFLSNGEWIRYLLIARMLRLIRLLMHVQRYRAFVATFLTLVPSLMPYLGTIFCVMCFYCSVGLQIFGGIVNAGNPILESTELSEDDYLLFNFNDYSNGMVTLFNLMVMGNWQAWMESYKDLAGTPWTHVYFISFYLITILLLLNLVIAFVLEAFFAEMDLESSEKFEDDEEDKDDSRKDRRRNIGSKSRSARVNLLLHHILSAELQDKAAAIQAAQASTP